MNTRLGTLTVGLVAFAAGVVTGIAISGEGSSEVDSDNHWAIIERYNVQMQDPNNREEIDGMVAVREAVDPLPALTALVARNEIEHVDLVFPNVPKSRKANAHWIEFVDEHPDILYAEGNAEYVDYKPSGEQPLHLNMWFRESAKDDIRKLIRQLEQFAE